MRWCRSVPLNPHSVRAIPVWPYIYITPTLKYCNSRHRVQVLSMALSVSIPVYSYRCSSTYVHYSKLAAFHFCKPKPRRSESSACTNAWIEFYLQCACLLQNGGSFLENGVRLNGRTDSANGEPCDTTLDGPRQNARTNVMWPDAYNLLSLLVIPRWGWRAVHVFTLLWIIGPPEPHFVTTNSAIHTGTSSYIANTNTLTLLIAN